MSASDRTVATYGGDVPPLPRANAHLFGHEGAEATLRSAADRGRLHHAWLLHGPDGIGKATLAFRFARALLAGFPGELLAVPADHPVARRVGAGSHPDLLALARSWDEKRKKRRTEIVADEVRAIGEFLALTPAEGGWRVVVIDGAEDLNRHAANAVLKLLEEPPPRAVLLLCTASPGLLLPTLRSRCRSLPLRRLDDAAVARALRAVRPSLDDESRRSLLARASGSPGRAIALATDGTPLDTLAEAAVARAERAAPGDPATREDEALAEQVARAEDGVASFTVALRSALERRARALAPVDLGAASVMAAASVAVASAGEDAERLNLDKREAILTALRCVRAA